MEFKKEFEKKIELANKAIEKFLPNDDDHIGELAKAMRYSVIVGGKRIRPVMMRECYHLFGGEGSGIYPFMAAMEFIHTASLIHDDLPALDNDSLRRGNPTTHVKFGEPIGILAGDALLNYAYEVLMDAVEKTSDAGNAVRAARIISLKAGFMGMLGGQDMDVETDKKGIDGDWPEILNYIYENKTAALIEASMMSGAALMGAQNEYIDLLEKAGSRTGQAFQIYDDILDVTSTTEKLGKNVFSDKKNGKDTYVSLYGLNNAIEKVHQLTNEALIILDGIPGDTRFLKKMITYLAMREM